jgi:hypothetical protein
MELYQENGATQAWPREIHRAILQLLATIIPDSNPTLQFMAGRSARSGQENRHFHRHPGPLFTF